MKKKDKLTWGLKEDGNKGKGVKSLDHG